MKTTIDALADLGDAAGWKREDVQAKGRVIQCLAGASDRPLLLKIPASLHCSRTLSLTARVPPSASEVELKGPSGFHVRHEVAPQSTTASDPQTFTWVLGAMKGPDRVETFAFSCVPTVANSKTSIYIGPRDDASASVLETRLDSVEAITIGVFVAAAGLMLVALAFAIGRLMASPTLALWVAGLPALGLVIAFASSWARKHFLQVALVPYRFAWSVRHALSAASITIAILVTWTITWPNAKEAVASQAKTQAKSDYTALVREQVKSALTADLRSRAKAAAKVFARSPYRPEGQLLFEAVEAASRVWSRTSMQECVRDFMDFGGEETVVRLLHAPARPNDVDSSAFGSYDPIVWYCSIVPEAEKERESVLKEQCLGRLEQLLRDHSDALPSLAKKRAVLQRLLLRGGLSNSVADPSLDEILQAARASDSDAAALGDTWLHLLDRAAQVCARTGQTADQSIEIFKRIVAIRREVESRGTPSVAWYRPPSKLLLFSMLRSFDDPPPDPKKETLVVEEPFGGLCAILQPRVGEWATSSPDITKRDFWYAKTLLARNLDLGKAIEDLLAIGWR